MLFDGGLSYDLNTKRFLGLYFADTMNISEILKYSLHNMFKKVSES